MELFGVWKSRGYGWILKIEPTSYALFDYTSKACIETERGSLDEFTNGFEVLESGHPDQLSIRIRQELSHYDFDRISALPEAALLLEHERKPDVMLNFEYFCEVFRQDYAFFELRGVDWEEACNAARQKITAQTSSQDLFKLLSQLIQPLQDNHVMLSDGKQLVVSEKIADIKALIQTKLGLRSVSLGDPYNVRKINAFINQELLGGNARSTGNDVVLWKMIEPGIGYINVLKLFGLADTELARTADDLPAKRPDHADFLAQDLLAIEGIMDEVMADLADAETIILDVRLNGGGFDTVGMSIANRFTDKKRLAFTKHARNGTDVTPRQNFYIAPAGSTPFTRPVYLLTSVRTASAGDIFAMCMRSLPHVTLVGQPSTGILSDNLKKYLPNGWVTSISNEFYSSADGKLFEGPGVPVDITTPVFVRDNFRAGYHLALDKALDLARQSSIQAIQ